MAKCRLNEKQKNLLRSIGPGLKDGTVKTEWSIAHGGRFLRVVDGLEDGGKLWQEVWKDVEFSDFYAFVDCEFFEVLHRDQHNIPGRFRLRDTLILEAIDSDFVMSDSMQGQQVTNYSLANISGSNISIASSNVQQAIESIPHMDAGDKAKLAELAEELFRELEAVRAEHPNEAELAAESTKMAVDELNKDNPNRARLEISVDGLKKAAENLKAVLPQVVLLAANIAALIGTFMK